MAQSLDISDLIRFQQQLSDVLKKKEIRKCFKEAHQIVGKEMERMVRRGLPGSKKVARWQVARFGSGGGFTAVSAEKGEYKGYAKGYITNAIENGHWSPLTANFRVKGLGFYAKARSELKQNAQKNAKILEQKIEEKLQNLGR